MLECIFRQTHVFISMERSAGMFMAYRSGTHPNTLSLPVCLIYAYKSVPMLAECPEPHITILWPYTQSELFTQRNIK